MKGKGLWLELAFASLVLVAPGAEAANTARFGLGSDNELRLMTGVLKAKSGEYVYDAYGSYTGISGHKLSELQWQVDNVLMAGAAFNYRGDSLHLNVEAWANAADGDGTMDDYDWLYEGPYWSHWSHHENTTLRKATQVDINAEFTLHGTQTDRFFGAVGYRRDHYDWQARGGTGIYSIDGFRDSYLVFEDVPGISYQQTFKTPYLGIGYEAASRSERIDIFLDTSIRYSRWAEAEAVDVHHLRDVRFEDGGTGGTWFAYGVTIDFRTRSRFSFLIGYSYQRYKEIRGPMTMTDLITGEQTHYAGDTGGLDNRSNLYSVGLNYRF